MEELERRMPEAHRQLIAIRDELEQEFGDMQDFEFTVEEGRLYMLQARSGKRTPFRGTSNCNGPREGGQDHAQGGVGFDQRH